MCGVHFRYVLHICCILHMFYAYICILCMQPCFHSHVIVLSFLVMHCRGCLIAFDGDMSTMSNIVYILFRIGHSVYYRTMCFVSLQRWSQRCRSGCDGAVLPVGVGGRLCPFFTLSDIGGGGSGVLTGVVPPGLVKSLSLPHTDFSKSAPHFTLK